MTGKPGFSRLIGTFGFFVLVAVAALWWTTGETPEPKPPAEDQNRPRQDQVSVVNRVVHLYFGSPRGRYLIAEQRVMGQSDDPVAFCRILIEALIEGPRKEGGRTLPADTVVRANYLLNDGTAVIDFDADAFVNHPGGVESELLSIYSTVNTLVLNIDAVRWVKFLIGGREAATLAGHVEIGQPFPADMLWVR